MIKPVQIIIVGVNGALNSGDQALCSATTRLVEQAFPGARVLGVHRNPELQGRFFPSVDWLQQIGGSYSTGRMARRFTNLFGLGIAAAHLTVRRHHCWLLPRQFRRTYQAIAGADLVIGCAGGWLEDHYVSIWTNLVHLSIAAAQGVPIFIAPQSIGPFRHRLTRTVAKKVLSGAAGVAVREEISLAQARDLGVPECRLRLFPDLALFEDDADEHQADSLLRQLCGPEPPKLAGTTVMPWSFPGSRDPSAEFERYIGKVETTARMLFQRTGIKTLLLRQIRDDRGFTGDRELVQRVAARTKDCAVPCPEYLEPPVLRGVIARCGAFWGSRMHSNIFAVTQGVPVVTIAYQHKAEGIMRMLGLGDYVVSISDFQPSDLVDLITRAIARRRELREMVSRRLCALQAEWGNLKRFLVESFEAHAAAH